MNFDKPIQYDPISGKWSLEFHKAPKFFSAQCGLKFSIDPGMPTGETGAYYEPDSTPGMKNSILEVRYFDNLSGYTSVVEFDLPILIQKLIEIMPSENVRKSTFCLAGEDRKGAGEA